MKKEDLFSAIGDVDEQKAAVAGMTMKKKKAAPIWHKWGLLAACLCLAIGLAVLTILNTHKPNEGAAGTLMGDTEIYPTVMVDGQLYEWRKGAAICDRLPSDSMYYGEITHADGEIPTKDCELVSVFSVSGQIYTVSKNSENVYLCLTTDWMTDTIVVFDLVGGGTSNP